MVDWTARVPDTVVVSAVELPRVVCSATVKLPKTVAASSITVTPVAESKTKLPDTVSIVFAVVCAILILPNSTAPPLNVPDTVKLPPMNTLFAIPTPPDTIREPVVVDVD